MNSAIIILVLLYLALLWLVCGALFKPFGRIIIELFNNAFKPMFGDKKSKEDNNNERD